MTEYQGHWIVGGIVAVAVTLFIGLGNVFAQLYRIANALECRRIAERREQALEK